ncbi:unnamed protein product [Sphenostylis stenocarpa]|uniref:Uncharacterized protein n=1 Tax=Sphenostylis stenocarpa TaxID=92480 RepID=A0AA86SUU2_9FABA|nr:unnamed protein product [Sphenostylis stenocarpa]
MKYLTRRGTPTINASDDSLFLPSFQTPKRENTAIPSRAHHLDGPFHSYVHQRYLFSFSAHRNQKPPNSSCTIVTPLATQHAGDLAQRADASDGGVGDGELGGRRRDGLGGA